MNIMEPVSWYIAFLFSSTVHEAAHAWAALKGGDPTAYEGGQVSLDPLPHIKREPVGMVLLPIISSIIMGWPFGYASAPYNPLWASRHPKKAAWMALAGPASNFLLVLISIAIIWIGIFSGIFVVPESVNYTSIVEATGNGLSSAFAFVISIFFTLNLVLTILNLIPLPPLDGSTAITLLLSEEKAANVQSMLNNPSFGFIGLFIAWKIFDPVFHSLFLFVISAIYPGYYS